MKKLGKGQDLTKVLHPIFQNKNYKNNQKKKHKILIVSTMTNRPEVWVIGKNMNQKLFSIKKSYQRRFRLFHCCKTQKNSFVKNSLSLIY